MACMYSSKSTSFNKYDISHLTSVAKLVIQNKVCDMEHEFSGLTFAMLNISLRYFTELGQKHTYIINCAMYWTCYKIERENCIDSYPFDEMHACTKNFPHDGFDICQAVTSVAVSRDKP